MSRQELFAEVAKRLPNASKLTLQVHYPKHPAADSTGHIYVTLAIGNSGVVGVIGGEEVLLTRADLEAAIRLLGGGP